MLVQLAMEAVLIATIAIGLSGSLLAWRQRPEPGAVPLTAFLAGACWWSAALFFQINATEIVTKVFWVRVSWLGVAVLPVAWLFFCLSYTGYDDYLKPSYVAVASVVPFLTVVFALTNDAHHLLYTGATLVEQRGNVALSLSPGVWFWVIAGYTYLLGFLGAIPLLGFVSSKLATFRGQSLALLVGLVTPWLTNVLHLLGVLPTGGIDPTPVAFSTSAVVFLGALTRFRLLDTSPAPIRPARRLAFERMEGGIIVLDRGNNIVELNERAAEILSEASDTFLGKEITAISPQFETLIGAGVGSGSMVFRPDSGTGTYDVSLAELTDIHGRTTGRIVTMHDISEYMRQQQRLEVLNRVFRHNIRTNSQVVIGHVEYLADHNSKERANEAQEKVMEFTEFGDKIRTILDVFERGRKEPSPVPLDRILTDVVDAVRSAYPDVTVTTDECPGGLQVDAILEDVLSNVVENAAQHNTNTDPEVRIDVESDDDAVRVTVRDNGPGIDDEELALLYQGSETPLNHGSGLGLALIVWGTEIIDGRVSIESDDPDGTVVTVEVPTLGSGEDG